MATRTKKEQYQEKQDRKTFVFLSAQMDEALALFNDLKVNKTTIKKKVLRSVGVKAYQYAKRQYGKRLKKRTGTLYKSVERHLIYKGRAVVVSAPATAEKVDSKGKQVRYGYVLAAGVTLKPKKDDFLTFQVDGKWRRMKEVVIPPRDWVESPVRHYLGTMEFKEEFDKIVQRILTTTEEKIARNAAKKAERAAAK